MGTEQEKVANRARMWALTSMGMAMGIWDMVEDSAVSLSPLIGEQILSMAEKIFHLELAGENSEKIMVDLGRIFVNEFGLCGEVTVAMQEKSIVATLKDSIGINELKALKAHGLEKPFSHPFVCTGLAALARKGIKARANLEISPNDKDTIVTFDLLN